MKELDNLKQKSIDSIIWNLAERYGIQLFSLIIGIILARLLTPADYGLIGMVTVFFAFAMVFVNGGFGKAYIQKKEADDVDASTIFFFNLIVSILFYFILWYSAPLIADFYNQEQLVNLIRVASIVLIINSFSIIQIAKLIKEVNFKKKSIISLASTIISGVLGIIFALFGYGVWSLIIQYISKALINVTGLWVFYRWRPLFVFSITSLKTMFPFGSWVLLSGLTVAFFNNINILVIGKIFPVAQLGFFTKAKSYRDMVSLQPVSAISAVSFPVLSKLQDDKVASKNTMKKFMTHTLFLTAFVSINLMVIAKPLFLIVLTEKWMPAVPYFQLLLVVGFFYPINLFNIQLLMAQGKSKLNFNLSLLKNSLTLLNLIVMYRFGINYIIYGLIAIAIINLFINSYFTMKLINYGVYEQFKDVYKTLFISVSIIISGFFFLSFFMNDLVKIIIGIVYTTGAYFVLQYVFNNELLVSNLETIKGKLKG